MTTKRLITVLVTLFALSLTVRIYWANFDAPLSGDEPKYNSLATQILEGKGFTNEDGQPTAWRTPGFPLLLAAIYSIQGTNYIYAKYTLVLMSSLGVLAIYWLSFLISKEHQIALFSAIAWTFSYSNIVFASNMIGETSATLFMMTAFCAFIISLNKRPYVELTGIAFAGLLVGMAILTRGYLLLAIFCLPALLLSQRRGKLAVLSLLFAVLIPFGWIIRNYITLGSPTLSTETYEVVWLGNNSWTSGSFNGDYFQPNSEQKNYIIERHHGFPEEMNEVERAEVFRREAANEVLNNPLRILWLIPRKLAVFLNPKSYIGFDWAYLVCIPFSILGLLLILKDKNKRNWFWIIACPIICVAIICSITFGDTRFRFTVDFGFFILAAVGLNWLLSKIKIIRLRNKTG